MQLGKINPFGLEEQGRHSGKNQTWSWYYQMVWWILKHLNIKGGTASSSAGGRKVKELFQAESRKQDVWDVRQMGHQLEDLVGSK